MDLIAQRHRVARKEHKCDLCNGKIEKGTKYSYAFIKDNGDHWSFKSHLECEFVANELWDFINPWDGMRDDDFFDGCHDFCQHMICPKCPHFDGNCCDQDEYFCFDKIVEVLKEYDFTLIKCDLPEARGKRCWGFVKKENPITKLPRYEK